MPIAEPALGPPRSPAAGGRSWAWPLATLLMVVVVCAAALGGYALYRFSNAVASVTDLPTRMVSGLAAAFRPTVNVQTTIVTAIGALKSNPKLVVLTADVTAEVHKASSTSWGLVYLGTTSVDIRTEGNQVQYYVPLDTLGSSDFEYDPEHKRLTVTVPAPLLDQDMVSVQSDPQRIDVQTSVGWAKLDRWSGAPLRDAAMKDLRRAVILAGNHPLLRTQARVNAQEQIKEKIAGPLTSALVPGVEIAVKFRP
jgi:hypothetical protein